MSNTRLAIIISILILLICGYLYFRLDVYEPIKPREILDDVAKQMKANKQIKGEIEDRILILNKAMKRQKINKLKHTFCADCEPICNDKLKDYIKYLMKKRLVMKLEYVFVNEGNITVGIGFYDNNEKLDIADELYGRSVEDLHFKCNYFYLEKYE